MNQSSNKMKKRKQSTSLYRRCFCDGIKDLSRVLALTVSSAVVRPWTQVRKDILDAVKKSGAKQRSSCQNNGNILMAAKQAAAVADIPVGIVPTKTISQGMTVMLSLIPMAASTTTWKQWPKPIENCQEWWNHEGYQKDRNRWCQKSRRTTSWVSWTVALKFATTELIKTQLRRLPICSTKKVRDCDLLFWCRLYWRRSQRSCWGNSKVKWMKISNWKSTRVVNQSITSSSLWIINTLFSRKENG